MSLATISSNAWADIFAKTTADYIAKGYTLALARQCAREDMARAFRLDKQAYSAEDQKDRDDERNGDWTR